MQNKHENTIACWAKIWSESICFAIWNVDTAVGEANIINNVSSSISLNPSAIDIGINTSGTSTNLLETTNIMWLIYSFISEKENDPPNNISDKGVASFDTSLIDFSRNVGNLKF